MKSDKWVITYNDINHENKLLYGYETIKGQTAIDALKKRFGKQFKRLTGDAGRFANVILVKGYCENNAIRYSGKYQAICYGIINNQEG